MDVIRQIAAVGAVLALLATALWWLRRYGFAVASPARKPAGRRLQRLERLPLDARHTLHLVRLGETTLLLASSPSGCALVQSMPCRDAGGSREVVR